MKELRLLVLGQLILTVLVCLTLIQDALCRREAVVLEIPSFEGPDSGEIVALDEDGLTRWTQQWSQDVRETESGTRMIFFQESGHGVHSPFENPVHWKINSVWESDSRFRPLRMERNFFDSNWRSLQKESIVLNWEKGIAEFEKVVAKDNFVERETIQIPPDTLIISGIASALRGFRFQK